MSLSSFHTLSFSVHLLTFKYLAFHRPTTHFYRNTCILFSKAKCVSISLPKTMHNTGESIYHYQSGPGHKVPPCRHSCADQSTTYVLPSSLLIPLCIPQLPHIVVAFFIFHLQAKTIVASCLSLGLWVCSERLLRAHPASSSIHPFTLHVR